MTARAIVDGVKMKHEGGKWVEDNPVKVRRSLLKRIFDTIMDKCLDKNRVKSEAKG